jgi:Fe/S biogenesis protein NfuA
MDTVVTSPVVTVTEAARAKIAELLAVEDDADTLGLRVAVTGASAADYLYDLAFEPVAEAEPDDVVYAQAELTMMVPAASVDALQGATLDLPSSEGQSGLVIRNPNRPDPLAGVQLDLTGSIAEKITQLLEQQINPALASHGGYATLVGVEDDTRVFITMGGGCQGCAVSAMTLREGIERSIKDNVPEVTEVVDATDHGAGDNPYYS